MHGQAFFGMLKSLHSTRAAGNLRQLVEMEIDYGIKYDRHSMFVDDQLKPMLKPIANYFRDPQHTLFSTGVGESEVAGVVLEMNRHGKTIDDLRRYSVDYLFPKRVTKVDPRWFQKKMFSTFGTKHFAGDMIAVIYLVGAFLQDEVAPGLMDKHIECFMLLVRITAIVMSAGDATASVIDGLRSAVDRHAVLFSELYDDPKMYKVKWHHLLHLPDDLLRLGKLLSCFPMERKHKDIKVHMVNNFKNVEHTTVCGYLNATVTSIINGQTQFKPDFLLDPVDGRSSRAVLQCGAIHRGDMVLFTLDDGRRALGEVKGFLAASDSPLLAHVLAFTPCSRTGQRWWNTCDGHETIIVGRQVIGAVPYRFASDHRIRIIESALL